MNNSLELEKTVKLQAKAIELLEITNSQKDSYIEDLKKQVSFLINHANDLQKVCDETMALNKDIMTQLKEVDDFFESHAK